MLDATIRELHREIAEQPFEQYGWLVIDSREQTVEQTVDAILSRIAEAKPGPARANIDRRGVLDEEVFSYRASKEKVFLFWHGKQVMILKGRQAQRFLAKIAGLEGKAAQLIMAKITGHFKHGNER